MMGQMSSCTNGAPTSSQIIGNQNISYVKIDDVICKALIDTGSQVTTISHRFLADSLPKCKIRPLREFITLTAAGGHNLPYDGYVETEINLHPDSSQHVYPVVALVVPGEAYSEDVPVIIGTNLISWLVKTAGQHDHNVSPAVAAALKSLRLQGNSDGLLGHVKSMKAEVIPAGQTKMVTGVSQAVKDVPNSKVLAMTESVCEEALPGGLLVTPGVMCIQNQPASSNQIPVEIQNLSKRTLTIPARSTICALYHVREAQPLENPEPSSVLATDPMLDSIKWPEEPEHCQALKTLLEKWKHVFSMNELDLTHTPLIKHHINLTDEQPIKIAHRRIPNNMYEEVKSHLRDMLAAGHISPSKSPWSFPVVLVRKKDNSLRFCVDYRQLNKRTVRDAYALPNIEETMDALCGATLFSCLDLRSGYWQVEVAEEHKERTAFNIGPLGFYHFNSMPFGLTNSPATFQRLMETCLGDLHLSQCLIYLDDIIVYSSNVQEHISRLEAVFKRLADAGLKLKPSKCEFFKSEVKYLGHVVSADGIKTDPEKIEVVKNWPVPSNLHELQQYLGFVGFYRKFVKNFSKIAHPLFKLLRGTGTSKKKTKSAQFEWTEEQQAAFEKLKHMLTSTPILGYANYKRPFQIHIDASMSGLGAVLYQTQDDIPRVIAYASRSLKPSEVHYPAHKLEFLALKWAISDKFHDYLYGQHFDVYTDNNPLTYVLTTARLDATGHRWLARLSMYDFDIHYKSGKTNQDADALSRLPAVKGPVIHAICSSLCADGYILTLPVNAQDSEAETQHATSLIEPVDVAQEQQNDDIIMKVINWKQRSCRPSKLNLRSSSSELRSLMKEWDKLHLKDGILFRSVHSDNGQIEQLVVPRSCRQHILVSLHDNMAHPGRDKTLALVQERFYWPKMSTEVINKVAKCRRCICRKAASQKAPLVPITSTQPLELVCMDYLLVEPSSGYEHLLVITDHFTKFARVIPCKNESAKTTAKALVENFINIYGYPKTLHADQGRCFESSVIKEICTLTGMRKSRTTPYHPMGNGACERFNQTLLKMLGTLAEDQKSRWKDHLNTLVHAYNCTTHESTGYSPYELMFGRKPRLPIDDEFGLKTSEETDYSSYVTKLQEQIVLSRKLALERILKTGEKFKDKISSRTNATLKEGDLVLMRKLGLQGRNKLADRWDDAVYHVLKQPHDDIPVYEIERQEDGLQKTVHRNLLLPLCMEVVDNPEVEDHPEVEDQPPSTAATSEISLPSSEEPTVQNDLPGTDDKSATSKEGKPDVHVPVRRSTRLKKKPNRFTANHAVIKTDVNFGQKSQFILELVDKILK